MIELASRKQAIVRQSVSDAELNAACMAAKSTDAHMLFTEELGLTRSNNIVESQLVDNSSSIEISVGKSLSKRAKSLRTRELGIRSKVQCPISRFQFEIGKISTELNPSDGGTEALSHNEWQKFKEHADILDVTLNDPGNLGEIPEKYGKTMGECVCAETKYRRGHYK